MEKIKGEFGFNPIVKLITISVNVPTVAIRLPKASNKAHRKPNKVNSIGVNHNASCRERTVLVLAMKNKGMHQSAVCFLSCLLPGKSVNEANKVPTAKAIAMSKFVV